MVRDRLGSRLQRDQKREDLGVHADHLLAEERPPGHAIVGVLGEGYRDDIGNQPEPSHTFGSFSPVRREVRWLAGAAEDQVPDDPSVAHGDRQPLAHDRIVISRGVADQDDPLRKGRVRPGVIAWVGGARAGGIPAATKPDNG